MVPALEEYRTSGYQLGITALYVLLADSICPAGKSNTRMKSSKRTTTAEDNSERIFEPELLRLKAKTTMAGDASEAMNTAIALLRQGLAIANDQRAVSLALRIATDLAALETTQGERQNGRECLAPIYARFTEGYDTSDLKRARSLLDAGS